MRKTPASILLAAAAALSAQAAVPSFAEPIPQGGFQEWTTDQDVDEEAKPDSHLASINTPNKRRFAFPSAKVRIAGSRQKDYDFQRSSTSKGLQWEALLCRKQRIRI